MLCLFRVPCLSSLSHILTTTWLSLLTLTSRFDESSVLRCEMARKVRVGIKQWSPT